MKAKNDLQEQKAFDNVDFSKEDERLYEMLFEELSREDEIAINPDFAPNIVAKLNKKRRREQLKENFLFAASILFVILITYGGLQLSQGLLDSQKTILSNRIFLPLFSLVGLITVFQVVDKMYIRNRRFNRLKLK